MKVDWKRSNGDPMSPFVESLLTWLRASLGLCSSFKHLWLQVDGTKTDKKVAQKHFKKKKKSPSALSFKVEKWRKHLFSNDVIAFGPGFSTAAVPLAGGQGGGGASRGHQLDVVGRVEAHLAAAQLPFTPALLVLLAELQQLLACKERHRKSAHHKIKASQQDSLSSLGSLFKWTGSVVWRCQLVLVKLFFCGALMVY